MGCDNNKNFNSNIGFAEVLDLNVTYTGCQHECNGSVILPGMNIRTILDVLLSNCGGTPTTDGTNFWFGVGIPSFLTAKADDYYLQSNGSIWQFQNNVWTNTGIVIGGGTGPTEAVWGEITGDINNQTDLLAFIQENAINPTNIGLNLRLDDAGVLQVGQPNETAETVNADYIILAPNAYDPFNPTTPVPNLTLVDLAGSQIATLNAPGNVTVKSDSGIVNISSRPTDDALIEVDGGVPVINMRINGTPRLTIDNTSATMTGGGSSIIAGTNSIIILGGVGKVESNTNGLFAFSQRSQWQSGIRFSNVQAGSGNQIQVRQFDSTNNVEQAADFRYLVEPNLIDALQIVHKGYVDALQAQVTALEARVAALEGA